MGQAGHRCDADHAGLSAGLEQGMAQAGYLETAGQVGIDQAVIFAEFKIHGGLANIGADVILDLAGGDFVEPSWRCVALEGRYIAAGFADDDENGFTGKPLRPSCAGNFSIIGVLMSWNDNLPAEIRRMGINVFGREVANE